MKKSSLFRPAHVLPGVLGAVQRRWVRAAFSFMLLAAGCGDDGTGPEGPTLTGTWTDAIEEIDGNTFDFRLMLNQSGSSVSGSYTLTVGLPLGGASVTGTYNHPDLRLSFPLSVDVFGTALSTSCTYTATVNGDRSSMRGTLSCAAAGDGEISLDEVSIDVALTKQ